MISSICGLTWKEKKKFVELREMKGLELVSCMIIWKQGSEKPLSKKPSPLGFCVLGFIWFHVFI